MDPTCVSTLRLTTTRTLHITKATNFVIEWTDLRIAVPLR